MMKKFISVLLCAAMLLGCFAAAASASPVLGDVNGDGSVTAADARLALRAAVKLETLTEEQAALAEVDGNGQITAADARIILRAAVRLMRMNAEGTAYEDVPLPPEPKETAGEKLRAFLSANATDQSNGLQYYAYTVGNIDYYFILDPTGGDGYPFGVEAFYVYEGLTYDTGVWFNETFSEYVIAFYLYDDDENVYVSAEYNVTSAKLSPSLPQNALTETEYSGPDEIRSDVQRISGNMAAAGLALLVDDLQSAGVEIDYKKDMHLKNLLGE